MGALVVGVAASLVVVLPGADAAPAVPGGFLLRDTPTGLAQRGDLVTDFAYLPDASVVAVGKYGRVVWVPNGGVPRLLGTLGVRAEQDLGLVGVGVAADYASSRHLYTARSVPSTAADAGRYGVLRLSRWTVRLDASGEPSGLDDEHTIVETSADSDVHGMTGIVVTPDAIWLSVGDSSDFRFVDQRALRAGSRDDLHGKVLRLTPDGSGLPDNPYYDPADPRAPRSLVYASGFRSPFRFGLDPVTGTPVVGDVGWNVWEEVNHLTPGGDYGWPCWEGSATTAGYRDLPGCANRSTVTPQHAYSHAAKLGSSVTGGAVYTGANYPPEYAGRYFFGDYTSGLIWTMRFDSAGRAITAPQGWGATVGAPVAIKAAPVSGDIVYADIATGNLRRIVYQPGNRPPTADLATTTDPATGTVAFDATGSTDPDGEPLTYAWDFGDGTTGTGATPSHTYPAGPSFPVTLTVTDPLGATATATATVHPRNHTPALSLTPPNPDQRFGVGEVITASAGATDPEDGAVAVEWTTDLVHCRGQDCHSHQGVRQSGPDFAMTFDGHPGDSRLEITATATDSLGARARATFTALPRQRRLSIHSPTPADFTLGDQQSTSELFTVGQRIAVIAPETARDGVATFGGWADGAPRVRELVMPDADVAYQASYLTPIDLRVAADPALRALLGAPTAVEQGDTTVRWREFTGGRVYWSPATGVREVHGLILRAYLAAGGHLGYGLPVTDEQATGAGRYNDFTGGRSIVWSRETDARLIHGQIRTRWRAVGAESSVLRYPITSETATADRVGRYNHFQGGSIYWTPGTGAQEVYGSIRARWRDMGWESSVLRYPTTGERGTADGIGRYNHFEGGSIYWTPATGAHEVYGSIRARWRDLGWERSFLRYPTSGEFAVTGGRRGNFEGGYIIYRFADRSTTAYRW
ncbi:PQQ-dependent sugar dehydrogenase [Actinokineospora sp. 24-640]